VFVWVVFAAVTTIGTTVDTTIGAIPGANPTPKAARLTASRAGEALFVRKGMKDMVAYLACLVERVEKLDESVSINSKVL
jgi:hypothetical protein